MKGHPSLKEFATQRGLAELLGRSESLVCRVEIGTLEMTQNLKNDIVKMTGVSEKWLSASHETGATILAESGMPLSHADVMSKIEAEITRNHQEAAENFSKVASYPIQNRIAASWLKLVEEAVLEGLNRGDTGLMDEITKILLKYPVTRADAE
ncbi:hypothetical protein JIN84_17190 [Luteolibacter yonseiensis]|uniref:Uncharacterized protein n=1 Tax=Luteolibacter yonseiensis TaxID=1144680 RepID=A0A934VDA5_9BACT|nr:hypothetical protein [Luteolibacter yonseiensis]MBK1817359.1 hypothetical protein [Luteolibacter yonseiensis]